MGSVGQIWDQWDAVPRAPAAEKRAAGQMGLNLRTAISRRKSNQAQREAEPGSPNNCNFISLVFSNTFSSHFNLMDEECNNET